MKTNTEQALHVPRRNRQGNGRCKMSLLEISALLENTYFRLKLNGKSPDNIKLQVLERKANGSGWVWVKCAVYRYKKQFLSCATAADILRQAANAIAYGDEKHPLVSLAGQIEAKVKGGVK